MRRHIKKQLLDIAESMQTANELLKKLLKKKDSAQVSAILIDQQQAALQIGETIESLEGAGTLTVELLESYCEQLWKCSEAEDIYIQTKLLKLLTTSCRKILESIRWDIPEQYDIVFLPYKASMWDSMESVWLAAKEDKNCNCYVIPIPYYDRKPDFSFGAMHYEGDQYPDYVPITSYNDYKLQSKHPEVVIIHNPYDQGNIVTSVEPSFYTSAIKKCTDMLVYIPYFVACGDISTKQCITSGVFYSDKVFVQSERIREIYIRAWKEELKLTDTAVKEIGLHEKFLAMGSPKIDKVVNTRREDVVLPKEWEDKIYG